MVADLVLFNGRLHTLDVARPLASALAICDGKIVYVGDDVTARSLLRSSPGAEAVDLRGRCVLPGLTDAHLHFDWLAMGLQQIDAETATLDEVLVRVARRATELAAGTWIQGYGWNHNVWGGEFPTAAQLDRVAPNHPVSLGAKSGHASWHNSAALALAGVTAATPDPANGQIVRDASGRPAGVLLEDAMNLVKAVVPEPTVEAMAEAMRGALPGANRAGLTGIHDFGGPTALAAHQLLRQRGQSTLRVVKSIPIDRLDEAVALGVRSGLGDDWLRIGHVKIFADGALGPRTAWMVEGYDTAPDVTGIAVRQPQELVEAVRKANGAGLACAIHAIGDRANREVLNAFEGAQAPHGTLAARNRIEHVQLLHPADQARLAALGIVASMQPLHATSDMVMADRHWGARCAGAYALKTQLDRGAVLALGSDCPVEVLDPLVGIHAAVTRRRADGTPGPEGWHPEQRLTVEEAVRGFTWGAAYAAGMEGRLGSLTAGKLADLTILERDIFAIDPMEILGAGIAGTVVAGKFVYRAV